MYSVRRLTIVYTLQQTLHWASVGIFIPIMALFVLSRGLNLLELGLVLSAYSVTIILLELPTGGLSDSIGRKRVYLISLAMKVAALSVLIVSQSMTLMMTGFVLLGADRALSSGSMDAWFVDEYYRIGPPSGLQRVLANTQVIVLIGIGAASVVGGLVPMWLGPWTDAMTGLGIYTANLIVGLMLVAIQAALVTVLVHEHPVQGGPGTQGLSHVLAVSLRYGFANPVIRSLMIGTLALGMGISGLELLWQPRVEQIIGPGSDTWIYGVISAGYFMMGAVANIAVTPLCSALGGDYSKALFLVRTVSGIALVMLALQASLGGFVMLYMFVYLFMSMGSTPHAAIFNAEVPGDRRATMMSFESLVSQSGSAIAALMLGVVSQVWSIGSAWLLGAMVLLGSAFIYLLPSVRARARALADDM